MDRDQTMRANYMAAENVIIQDLGDRSDDELSEQESPTAVASVVQANTTVHHLNISNTDNITFPDGVRVCISERFEEQLKAYNVSLLYFFMGTLTLILIGVGLCFLFFVLQRSNINDTDVLRIVKYSEWSNESLSEALNDLKHPVKHIIIGQIGSTDNTKTIGRLLEIREHDMRNSADIIYNFLVAEDGNLYEGRGWNKQPNVNASWNENSILIGLLGEFTEKSPQKAQLNGIDRLIEGGERLKKIDPDGYELNSLCQVSLEGCINGRCLIKHIKKMRHWNGKVESWAFNRYYNSNTTEEDEKECIEKSDLVVSLTLKKGLL